MWPINGRLDHNSQTANRYLNVWCDFPDTNQDLLTIQRCVWRSKTEETGGGEEFQTDRRETGSEAVKWVELAYPTSGY